MVIFKIYIILHVTVMYMFHIRVVCIVLFIIIISRIYYYYYMV